jgi:hypothetical protein
LLCIPWARHCTCIMQTYLNELHEFNVRTELSTFKYWEETRNPQYASESKIHSILIEQIFENRFYTRPYPRQENTVWSRQRCWATYFQKWYNECPIQSASQSYSWKYTWSSWHRRSFQMNFSIHTQRKDREKGNSHNKRHSRWWVKSELITFKRWKQKYHDKKDKQSRGKKLASYGLLWRFHIADVDCGGERNLVGCLGPAGRVRSSQ